MVEPNKSKRLNKELTLIDVYAIATGATLSAGFFLLPGLAAAEAGPAIVLSYMIAAIPLIPAILSMVELTTAMPKAGGVYFFLDRSLGPLVGMISGIGTWLVLVLKVSFALVGMGAYIAIFVPEIPIIPVAIALALGLGSINLLGSKKSGGFQIFLVFGLLALLIAFIGGGLPELRFDHFQGFFDAGFDSILSTAGLVYISYVGVTKVASISEEVKNPERNLPLGVFLALGTSLLIYGLGTAVMVGVVPSGTLAGNLTPVATAAKVFFGKTGEILLSIAALIAFISVANAGTMTASRYPLAMSRDHMIPPAFRQLSKNRTPSHSIQLTVGAIIAVLVLLDPIKIAKLASAFQLLIFAMVNLAVIVMRESRVESYDPGFRSPFYPWMQIFGIFSSILLIVEMGWLPLLFTIGLIVVGGLWYWYYARVKVERKGAVFHVFEQLGKKRHDILDRELRDYLKGKGLREEDPFDEIVQESLIIDLKEKAQFKDVVEKAASLLSQHVPYSVEEIKEGFLEGTRIGATPVMQGVALPHMRIKGLIGPKIVMVRSKGGVRIQVNNPLGRNRKEKLIVFAIFFLISPEEKPTQHLRILAQIARRVDEESFALDWDSAESEQELKEALLREERSLSLLLSSDTSTVSLIGRPLREIDIPDGCLIVLFRRKGNNYVPKGHTVFKEGDYLTIIGNHQGLRQLNKLYVNESKILNAI